MKKENIVRFTLEEIRERRRKGLSKTDWDRINAMTPEEIERLADEDDEMLGIKPEDWGEPRWVDGIGIDETDQEEDDREAESPV
jgi:hypothetical protein